MDERSQVAETAFLSIVGAGFQVRFGNNGPRAVESS